MHYKPVADPGFPRGGAPTPQGGGCQHTILPKFPKNCIKLKEFAPLDPPLQANNTILLTRMHSSRMHTTHSSGRVGGRSPPGSPPGNRHPPGPGTPREQTPPGPGIPPEQTPWDQAPLRSRPPWDQLPTRNRHPPGTRHPPVNRMTDACENITLPQLRCGR